MLGPTLVSCDSATPATPAMPGAEAEGQRIDARRAHPHGPRHGPVLRHRPHLQAQRVRFRISSSAKNTSSAKNRM
jgi:hypothetical protein